MNRTVGTGTAKPRPTIGDFLEQVLVSSSQGASALRWPPDAFGLCAYLLKLTGGYVDVVSEWPPQGPVSFHPKGMAWKDWAHKIGRKWRKVSLSKKAALPAELLRLWGVVLQRNGESLDSLAKDREAICALLQIVAIADEASVAVGIPGGPVDKFSGHARVLLAGRFVGDDATLSPRLPRTMVRVLPKQHTPRGGLTLRSLTHHLALHVGAEVTPFWHTVPQLTKSHSINLLVAPWPLKVRPAQFQPAKGALLEMPRNFGFVEFSADAEPEKVADWTAAMMKEAERLSGRVDGVVFPEAALAEPEYDRVRSTVLQRGAFLIAGTLQESSIVGEPPLNLVKFDAINRGLPMHVEQRKHHRWRLDRSQIETYGLGGSIDPNREWWEHIAIGCREVNFISLNEQMSLCCLICEDLARQDPVAELVRSVGPNLVVALLMDAPQLGSRWPARYATVLADDPGSSVLTLTSAGMVDLARVPPGAKPIRSIGLWKDARSNFVELELPKDASGLLLNICTEVVEEWTADGRSDEGVTGYPRLGGVHPIFVENPRPKLATPKAK